jgi:hypothetical protein
MSINPAKYIKLSTEPWTANGIREPVPSLTLQDIPTNPNTGSVKLETNSQSQLLINGVEIAGSGSSEVLSLTAQQGSALQIIPNVGAVQIGILNEQNGPVTRLDAIPPLEVTPIWAEGQPQTFVTVACSIDTFIPSLITNSYDINLSASVGDVVIGTFANITTPELSGSGTGQNIFTPLILDHSALASGVYLLEIQNTSSNVQNVAMGFNAVFRKYAGKVTLGAMNVIRTENIGGSCRQIITYALDDPNQYIYIFVVGSQGTGPRTVIGQIYRLL